MSKITEYPQILSCTEWRADQTTLLKLYCSLVRSKLDYGCIVYGSASKVALAKLDPVHNQGLRLSLGTSRSSPVESLYVEAQEPPLEIRREKLGLQYILKLKANPVNPAYDVVFNTKFYMQTKNQPQIPLEYTKKLLKKPKIDVGEIAINSIPDVPIWDSEPVTVDFTLSEVDKSSTSSTVFKSRFIEVKQKYLDFSHHELTVKHILIECNFLKIIRRRHYYVTDLNPLFKTVSSKRILDFVKDIGLYNNL